MYKKIPLLVAMQLLILSCASEKESESYTLSSPEGKNSIQFDMNGGSPHYSVNHGAIKVILPSSMGFVFKDQDSSLMSILNSADGILIREPNSPPIKKQQKVNILLFKDIFKFGI